jgi:hypothetical protein
VSKIQPGDRVRVRRTPYVLDHVPALADQVHVVSVVTPVDTTVLGFAFLIDLDTPDLHDVGPLIEDDVELVERMARIL